MADLYCKDTREMVAEIRKDVKELRNHYSQRLPLWAVMVLSVLMGFIGWIVK